jgi:hypothetical protein
MTASTSPEIGARILTHKGNQGIIESLEADRVSKAIVSQKNYRHSFETVPSRDLRGQLAQMKRQQKALPDNFLEQVLNSNYSS